MTFTPVSNISARSSLFIERRCQAMDWHPFLVFDRTKLVDRLADYVHHAAQGTAADGTEIGSTRAMAFMPRTIPSVASIAMQRTRPSPKCCWTSRITLTGLGTVKPSLTTRTAS